MEVEDSRNALFCDPNAYIQKPKKEDVKNKEIKKIIFQEPYETLPQYHVNNNFKKHSCDCVPNKEKQNNKPDCKSNSNNSKQNGFNLDVKSLMPLLGLFNKGGGTDLSSLVGMLNNNSSSGNIFSNLFSNKDMMSGIMNLFKGSGSRVKKQTQKKELKITDYEIKNYTKVE